MEVTNICNFRCSFCLNDGRSQMGQGIMSNDDFFRVIDEAVSLGAREVNMIPSSGDVFCDPGIYEKLEYLENKKEIKLAWFFTNYLAAKPEKLNHLKKIKMYVSVYGETDEEFVSLTNRPASYRHKVLENLEKSKDGPAFLRLHGRNFTYIDNKKQYVGKLKGLCSNLTHPYVHFNLDVTLCYCGLVMRDCNLIIGNLRDSAIAELMTSDKAKQHLKNHINNKHEPPCTKCGAFDKSDLNLEILKTLGK